MKVFAFVVATALGVFAYAQNLKYGDIVLFPFYGQYKSAIAVGAEPDTVGTVFNIRELQPVLYFGEGVVKLVATRTHRVNTHTLILKKNEDAITLGDGTVAKVGDEVSYKRIDGRVVSIPVTEIANGMISSSERGTFFRVADLFKTVDSSNDKPKAKESDEVQ